MTNNEPPKNVVLGPADQPLLTGDGMLAFALYLAGVQFCDNAMWCINYYTPEMLRGMGYKGMPLREAAMQAVKDGKRGTVRFLLKKPDIKLAMAFTAQEKEIEEGEGEARDALKNLLNDYKAGAWSYEEAAIRIACLILKMRATFMNAWKDQIPLIRIEELKEEQVRQPDGSTLVNYGGLKFISANAGKAIKEKLGV